jgi:hypothetical protein
LEIRPIVTRNFVTADYEPYWTSRFAKVAGRFSVFHRIYLLGSKIPKIGADVKVFEK